MDSKLIEWAKTVLLSHVVTPRLLGAITKENERMMNLGMGSRHYEQGLSTYDFLDKMLTLNIRKRNIIVLYNVVNDILRETPKEERELLEERFFGRKSIGELMPSINIRTAYRRYNTAIASFAKELEERGYTLEVLEDKFGDDRVIGLIHSRVMEHAVVFRSDEKQDVSDKQCEIIDLDAHNVDSVMTRLDDRVKTTLRLRA